MSFSRYDEDGARTSHHTHCCIGARRATHSTTGDDYDKMPWYLVPITNLKLTAETYLGHQGFDKYWFFFVFSILLCINRSHNFQTHIYNFHRYLKKSKAGSIKYTHYTLFIMHYTFHIIHSTQYAVHKKSKSDSN